MSLYLDINNITQSIMKRITSYLLLLLLSLIVFSCACERDEKEDIRERTYFKPKSKLVSPEAARYVLGDTLNIKVASVDQDVSIDSVHFYIGDQFIHTTDSSPYQFNYNTEDLKVGIHQVRTITFNSDSTQDVNRTSVILLSDVIPAEYRYRLIKTYPHDPEAFTQGLVYDGQYMYEGTGQKGVSNIRKVNLETGELLKVKYINSDLFGEGITLIDNKIIQLTWKSRVGFVYDKNTFELLKKFNYPTEGWGITTMGDKLIMSDGSATLYEWDKESFTETSRFEVYDNKGPVTDLNELEYINGSIFANIFQRDEIVIIDPSSGKVTGILNLEGLAEQNENVRQIDVLNGIAYDELNDRLFVTGKWWSKIYELEISPVTSPVAYSAE